MDIRHVLITRFNLATPGRETPFRLLPGWLEERFDLFERYCLPSVAAQDEQRFHWILYFDEHTPDWARARVERCRAVRDFHPFYTPVFDAGGWVRSVRDVIGPGRAGAALVTSNLDNDDGLAFDYIARVQAAALGFTGARFAVNIANGFVLAGPALFAHHHPRGAFTNMVEPDDDAIVTTMSIRHMELHRHLPIVQDEGPGAWLQVVHERNVSNRVRGRRADRREALGRFPPGAVADVADPGRLGRLVDRVAVAPGRALRDRAFAAIRRVIRVDRPG